ncbi:MULTISPECIES: DedA family protein [Paenibacillus]|uniref:DedA family protein n=1 Tax=Paenibacillus baimaensis TaxID=2982185 RepID=A0ABT2U8K2_9BACL|nr:MULTISPECIES: DedA family protein [unclassified Paenibacillus]MCU6790951.1 DedA family protein [Paenibacillus sp. WQ 127069]OMF20900.1 alkaline phosphatase [Paenibacillus sp. FSL H7-0331]
MNYDTLVSMIEHYGYAALFFSLWLGIVGMPIPDEVVVMTGGAVTGSGILQVIPAFVLTYLGVISGLSLGYILGRYVGTPVLDKLRRKPRMNKWIGFSERLIVKYGNFALCISYLLPVVRHIMPYLVGINKMSFRRYALLSYSSGLVWTLIFFTVGRFVGNHVQDVGVLVYNYGIRLLGLLGLCIVIIIIIRLVRRRDPAR